MQSVVLQLARILFWLFLLCLALHYFYVHAIGNDPALLRRSSLLTLGGVIYFFSELFFMKYLIIYGLSGALMTLDHLKPNRNPRCVVGMVYFSHMWKYFDPGLHHFVKTYVYIPLGGSRGGIGYKLFASFVSFLLIFYWHGGTYSLFMWSMYNYIGLMIEVATSEVAKMPAVIRFEEQYLGTAMTRRVHAIIYIPLYVFSIHAIFVFFTDVDIGWLFIDRFILKGDLLSWLLTVIPLYALIMLSNHHNGQAVQPFKDTNN